MPTRASTSRRTESASGGLVGRLVDGGGEQPHAVQAAAGVDRQGSRRIGPRPTRSIVRAITAAVLEDLGHTVVKAGDGPEALALVNGGGDRFDLLVSDYAMPKFSGAELIRQVREKSPEMPAIIITGYAESESIGQRPDNVAILPKPFTPEQLRSCLAAALEGSRAPV